MRSVLRRAQNRGEISLADLERIIKAAKGSQITPNEGDIADTIDAVAAMDIEIELISRIRRRAKERANEVVEILPQLGAAHGRAMIAPGSLAVNLDGLGAAHGRRHYTRADVTLTPSIKWMDALARKIKAQKAAVEGQKARRRPARRADP